MELKKSIRNPLFHDFRYVDRRQKSQPEFISQSQPNFKPPTNPETQRYPVQQAPPQQAPPQQPSAGQYAVPKLNLHVGPQSLSTSMFQDENAGGGARTGGVPKVGSVGNFGVARDSIDLLKAQQGGASSGGGAGKRSGPNYSELGSSGYENRGLTYVVPPERRHNTAFQYPYPVQQSPKVPVSS